MEDVQCGCVSVWIHARMQCDSVQVMCNVQCAVYSVQNVQ